MGVTSHLYIIKKDSDCSTPSKIYKKAKMVYNFGKYYRLPESVFSEDKVKDEDRLLIFIRSEDLVKLIEYYRQKIISYCKKISQNDELIKIFFKDYCEKWEQNYYPLYSLKNNKDNYHFDNNCNSSSFDHEIWELVRVIKLINTDKYDIFIDWR